METEQPSCSDSHLLKYKSHLLQEQLGSAPRVCRCVVGVRRCEEVGGGGRSWEEVGNPRLQGTVEDAELLSSALDEL